MKLAQVFGGLDLSYDLYSELAMRYVVSTAVSPSRSSGPCQSVPQLRILIYCGPALGSDSPLRRELNVVLRPRNALI